MIFKPELVEKILVGEKTPTRRPVKYDAEGRIVPCRYAVGGDYALQPGRTKPGIGPRLLVSSVKREPLGSITEFEAAREGFAGRGEFFDYWRRMHGRYDPHTQV